MAFIAGAVIGGIASLGGSMLAGSSAKSAAKSQAKAQERMNEATNEANYKMFKEGRGSEGHAVLPEYFGGFEKDLSTDLRSIYARTQRENNPSDPNSVGNLTYDAMKGGWLEGNDLVRRVMSGEVGEERGEFLDDISSARRSGINNALGERLAAIKLARKKNGMGGSSSVAEKSLLGNTIQARTAAAVADAADQQALYDQNLQLQLGLLDAPLNRARLGYQFGQLPVDQRYLAYDSLMQRLQPFNIGPAANLPYQNYQEAPTIPNSGQFLGSALSGLGGTMAQYAMLGGLQNGFGGGNSVPNPNAGVRQLMGPNTGGANQFAPAPFGQGLYADYFGSVPPVGGG